MKLTRRQEEFIHKLMDLYWEQRGPIHYSVLAERLRVSPFTAYDMLRLLEEKGQVTSQYQLDPEKSGPGRTVRVFMPSSEALETARHLGLLNTDWETFKQRILEKINKGDIKNPELAEEFLALVPPEGPQSLQYCTEVLTATALRLRHNPQRRQLVTYMDTLISEQEASSPATLCLLGGLAFGVLAEENSEDQDYIREIVDHIRKYKAAIQEMGDEERRQLTAYLQDLYKPLVNRG